VRFKGLIAAATSVALIATPTMVTAQTASAAAAEVAPATETVDEGSQLRGGFIIPLIALIAIILGLCVASDQCGDDDDLPHSP
jgi:hypothetical protein